ncbi:MAG: glutamyl-tRNA reductase [Lachnospiraceae bacterium]|jgi:glutamyl-tRNA reductase
MSIQMLGIDHNKAPVDIRALFSFTKKNAGAAMEAFYGEEGILGCIILSTCNRMEIWASTVEDWDGCLLEKLCSIKGVESSQYREYFVFREGQEAVEHLFYLTSGLKSQILAEDQIITQIKAALSLSREHFCTDNVLEVLFRMAVTAGKKVKTEVVFSHGNTSVIHQAIRFLADRNYSVQGKTCMVIGNGEMGKLAAQTLREEGADVTVTVRQYRSGIVNIPQGCKRINYGERMDYVPQCDLVVSATASPNFTLTVESFASVKRTKPLLLIDLAVPRDIEPGLDQLEDVTLYDIDSFKMDPTSLKMQESLEKAGVIIHAQMEEFHNWFTGKDLFPRIQEIKAEAVNDLNLRIMKILNKTPMEESDREMLLEVIDTAAGKVVNKMIFGLRDSLEQEAFAECVAGLERLYEE